MKTILLVEDDDALRNALSRALRHAGFDVRTANNGRQAFDSLTQHPADLVLAFEALQLVPEARPHLAVLGEQDHHHPREQGDGDQVHGTMRHTRFRAVSAAGAR